MHLPAATLPKAPAPTRRPSLFPRARFTIAPTQNWSLLARTLLSHPALARHVKQLSFPYEILEPVDDPEQPDVGDSLPDLQVLTYW